MGTDQRRSPEPERARPTFAEQTSAIDDATGPLGIRLISQPEGRRLHLRTTGPTLLVPVHSGLVEVVAGGARHVVDRSSWLLVPSGSRAVVRAKSPITHALALTVTTGLCAEVVRTYDGEIDPASFRRYLAEVQLLPRTLWVNELCHRYLFERAVCKRRDNVATKFLEMEIVKEVYFVCHERFTAKTRSSLVVTRTPVVQRAVALLEEHLFEPDVIQRVARGCGASPSTLLRHFKKELAFGPLAYVRRRRLDESMLLLKSQRFNVGEVAMMVGYRNFAAFSQAFRARFGMRPSDVRGET